MAGDGNTGGMSGELHGLQQSPAVGQGAREITDKRVAGAGCVQRFYLVRFDVMTFSV